MGSKRTGKERAWEKEGKIGFSPEPRVNEYFRGSYNTSSKSRNQSERKSNRNHLDFRQWWLKERIIQELNKMEKRWKRVNIPDKERLELIRKMANSLEARTIELDKEQPKCELLRESYDRKFSSFRLEVENTIERSEESLGLIDELRLIEKQLKKLFTDLHNLEKIATGKLPLPDYVSSRIFRLCLKLESFKRKSELWRNEDFKEIEQLADRFENVEKTLEKLTHSTHVWESLKPQTLTNEKEQARVGPIGTRGSLLENICTTEYRCKLCGRLCRNVNIPDFEEIRMKAVSITNDVARLRESQPDCKPLEEKYDEVFDGYKKDIEELSRKRKDVLKDLDSVLDRKQYLECPENIWQEFEATRDPLLRKLLRSLRRRRQREWETLVRSYDEVLQSIAMFYKKFDENRLREAGRLRTALGNLESELKKLSEPTHIWKPTKWIKVTTHPGTIRLDVGSIEAKPPQEQRIVTQYQCTRCGRARAHQTRKLKFRYP